MIRSAVTDPEMRGPASAVPFTGRRIRMKHRKPDAGWREWLEPVCWCVAELFIRLLNNNPYIYKRSPLFRLENMT